MKIKTTLQLCAIGATLLFLASCASDSHIQFVNAGKQNSAPVQKVHAENPSSDLMVLTTTSNKTLTNETQTVLSKTTHHQQEKKQNKIFETTSPNGTSNSIVASGSSSVMKMIPGILGRQLSVAMVKQQSKKSSDDQQLLYIIVAIFIPFLAVALFEGEITSHFWIDLLLTFLFYFPGLIYALIIILG